MSYVSTTPFGGAGRKYTFIAKTISLYASTTPFGAAGRAYSFTEKTLDFVTTSLTALVQKLRAEG